MKIISEKQRIIQETKRVVMPLGRYNRQVRIKLADIKGNSIRALIDSTYIEQYILNRIKTGKFVVSEEKKGAKYSRIQLKVANIK